MLKKIIISITLLVVLGTGAVYGAQAWLKGLLPDKSHFDALKQTQASELFYINEDVPEYRGRILAVVTSTDTMGEDKATGYEHTELARAYWVFVANGFEVEIASPKGGEPPRVIDGEDMGKYDYAFLNNTDIQAQISESIPLADVDASRYEAVYFVGGKGTMFDFPDNPDIKRITRELYQNGKVVSAVCHGPSALVNVKLDDGSYLLANKKVSGFTNEEELFLIPDAKDVFPFLLQDKMIEKGSDFQQGSRYMKQVSQDGKLITGQNPWSVWEMAELVIAELGYEPKPRIRTPEEHSIDLLMAYDKEGFDFVISAIEQNPQDYQRILIVMHAIVAFMEIDIGKGVDLIKIASRLKKLNE